MITRLIFPVALLMFTTACLARYTVPPDSPTATVTLDLESPWATGLFFFHFTDNQCSNHSVIWNGRFQEAKEATHRIQAGQRFFFGLQAQGGGACLAFASFEPASDTKYEISYKAEGNTCEVVSVTNLTNGKAVPTFKTEPSCARYL